MATKSAPVTSESGLTQLVTTSPVALPTGTRPPATAPTTVPRKNGVSTEAAPKTVVASARPRGRRAVCWNAKPDPRSTIPNAARLSGMKSVEKIASNADGEAGPEHDEDEDQPDVVRLPDRADRPVDQLARPRARPRRRRRAGSTGPRRSRRRRRPRTSSRRPPARRRRRSRCVIRRPPAAAAPVSGPYGTLVLARPRSASAATSRAGR